MSLNSGQEAAKALVLSGKNAWILGPPGVGKSFLIDNLVKSLTECGKTVAVTAMTGAAASNLTDAVTIHCFTGTGTESLKMHLSSFISSYENISEKNRMKLMDTDVIIHDEAGMMAGDQLEHFDKFLRRVRGKPNKFCGGIQLVLVGDIAQLPPIDSSEGAGEKRDKRLPMFSVFSFPDEDRWKVAVLNQFVRSAEDICLQQICLAIIDKNPIIRRLAIELLNKRCYREHLVSNFPAIIELSSQRGALIITPTNGRVDTYVRIEKAVKQVGEQIQLKQPTPLYKIENLTDAQINEAGGISGILREDKEIRERGTFHPNLSIFVGQQLQIRMNGNDGDQKYFNGEICMFIRMDGESVVVKRMKDSAILNINMCEHKTEYEKEVGKIGYLAYPLMPAIATNVHKVQGQTLHACIFDPSHMVMFGEDIPNLVFVCISRVKKCADLILTEPIAVDLISGSGIQKKLTALWDIDFMQNYPHADEALLRAFLAE